ncbi:uncharacterized protein LOC132696039 isoform X2 [Cylas formicarius]|nr:uncharacterized protein LOC132696039 isoform X2 [Cylas formicarius]XP_060516561.1 uncharacterized protein LOC132696039 isoform X2 [Cylas formicarius]
MSMNGRKQPKFNLAFKPLAEVPVHHENTNSSSTTMHPGNPNDYPPPPEEAQRLIATLLPIVSPGHRPKSVIPKYHNKMPKTRLPQTKIPLRTDTIPPPQRFQNSPNLNGVQGPVHSATATQTTLPKTRHQRPYGWESNEFILNPPPPPSGFRYGSLPYQHGLYPLTSPTRVPPRTIPTALERHREVRRHGSEDNLSSDLEETNNLRPLSELADDEHFSDDSLEDALPPPPPLCNKRSSIAWEVAFDDEALLTPGSTKVIGRRRRKSGSHSSTSSIPSRLKELEDWPDPPPCTTEDEVTSPFSDSDDHLVLPAELNSHISGTSTYIIRRGKKKDRQAVVASSATSISSVNSRLSSELSIPVSRHSVDIPPDILNKDDRLTRELNTPNSRYSIDLSTPHSRLSHELNSPKSRFSLDLNNSRHFSQELSSSPSRLSADLSSSRSSTPSKYNTEAKKHSTTFDNIKSLIREGVVQNYVPPLEEQAADLDMGQSSVVRVISLPSLNADELTHSRRELDITVEEEEDGDSSQQSSEISPLRKIEQNITELLERRDIELTQDGKFLLNGVDSLNKDRRDKKKGRSTKDRQANDIQKSSSHSEIQKSEDYYRQLLIEGGTPFPKRSGIQKSESAKEMLIAHRDRETRLPTSTSADFPVHVEVLQHEFPPLPPSPVEEADDEYSEILNPAQKKADTLPSSADSGPVVPPHAQHTNNFKTRSMESPYSRGRRNNFYISNRSNIPPERRTLPTELQDSKRRHFQKRSSHSPQEERHLQTSCSLPETPIFARGCDIPRTPHRRAPEIPGTQSAPRQSNTVGSLNTLGNMSTSSSYRRQLSHSGLEQAIVGADLLRLAGGPNRGWYPKQKTSRRPASIEHLDRMSTTNWENSARKPQTLPPNLTPKFFQRSPRDALRRVTSLLIRKGNNGKDTKKDKELVSPTIPENMAIPSEETHKKKGFFKSFWKRSRHYSLEQHH